MTMQDFLALFHTNSQTRYRAMALAQSGGNPV
jgi:hypothetical protein